MTYKSEIVFLSNHFKGALSTDISESEALSNAFLTYNSIGKLVRFENENQMPYIAESWERIGTKWIFKLIENLKCENGEHILPTSFKVSLQRSLRQLSDTANTVPIFEHLRGFKSFMKGEELKGIIADNEKFTLTFDFDKEMTSGVLEYLAMSPFGYICAANFTEAGDWKSPKEIISSAGYSLKYDEITATFVASIRPEWPLNPKNAVKSVLMTSNETFIKNPKKVIYFGSQPPPEIKKELKVLPGIPMSISIFSLLPNGTGFFSSKMARRKFKKRFREVQSENFYEDIEHESTVDFYFSQPYEGEKSEREPEPFVDIPKEPLKIRLSLSRKDEARIHVYDLVKKTLDSLKWPHEIITNSPNNYVDFKDPKYDARYSFSEVGMGVEAWVNEMLFCSNIGAEYPDPGGKICQLTEDYNEGKLSYDDFALKFAELIANEAAVIPVLKRRYIWYLGEDIARDSFSPLTNIPPFDLIRFKE